MGTAIGFIIASGLLTATGVYLGWTSAGAVGVAYGFLASRIALIAQDLFVIRLIDAKGWLAAGTWLGLLAQAGVACVFAHPQLFLARNSLWNLVPASLHALLVGLWLVRHPLGRMLQAGKVSGSAGLAASITPPPGT